MRRAFLALSLAACGTSLWTGWRWWPALESLLGARAGWLAATELAAPLVCLGAISRQPSLGAAAWGRVLLVAAGFAGTAFLAIVPHYQRLWLELALGPAAGIAALVLWLEIAIERGKLVRALLVALALGPPLCEVALRVLARVRPAPLLVRDELSPGRVLEQNRPPPGTSRFGMPCNAGGHFDEPFRRRGANERRVALIGDSFSQGVVPHALHYSTLAERALGFPVDNYGVPGIGPLEYEELLVREALPLDPSAVVIALFVGNDFELPPELTQTDPCLRSWLDRRSVLVWLLPGRLARIAQERRANPAGAARVQGERDAEDRSRSLEERFPWIADPARELPTISLEGFLKLERERAHLACGLNEDELARVVHVLERMRAECGARPFGVLLIPDEFQVEDALWAEVQAEGLERDRPQRLLGVELGKRGIPVLDLEPVLRGIAPLGDGRQHVYHLRDTHWNARGNRAAGEALSGFVRELLQAR